MNTGNSDLNERNTQLDKRVTLLNFLNNIYIYTYTLPAMEVIKNRWQHCTIIDKQCELVEAK